MLKVASEPLELRGISNTTSKKGTVYHTVNCETEDGTPYGFYCPDVSAIAPGLKKGDKVRVYFNVRRFNKEQRLEVMNVEKVQ